MAQIGFSITFGNSLDLQVLLVYIMLLSLGTMIFHGFRQLIFRNVKISDTLHYSPETFASFTQPSLAVDSVCFSG